MYLRLFVILLACLFAPSSSFAKGGNKHVKVNQKKVVDFAIVVYAHNAEAFCKHCLDSIISQSYSRYTIYFVNDGSTDNTLKIAESYVKRFNLNAICKFINNPQERGFLPSLTSAIEKISESKVVVPMYATDWFTNGHSLQTVASFYENPHVWLTYGLYQSYPHGHPSPSKAFPPEVFFLNDFRNYTWVTVPLRTFYAKLFHLIRKDDLQITNERMFTSGADAAYMFPMLEMASQYHIRYIDVPLVVCNMSNDSDTSRIVLDPHSDEARILKAKLPYAPIPSLFFSEFFK